jgi:hypothetical protein
MKKVLILLVTLIYCQNVFSVALTRLNSARVGIYQNELTKEIKSNRFLRHGVSGAAALVGTYLAIQYFKKAATPIEFDKDKVIEQLAKLHTEGKIAINQGLLESLKQPLKTTSLTTIVTGLYGFVLGQGVNFGCSKLFRTLDLNLIIQERTKIGALISYLKNTFAVLDNKSAMFEVQLPVEVNLKVGDDANVNTLEVASDVATQLSRFFANNNEIFTLKSIAAANISEQDISVKINAAVVLFNALVCDLEKVVAFMQYKADCYRSENMIEKRDNANALISEITSFIDYELNKVDRILTEIEVGKKVTENNGLLALIFNFQQKISEVVTRFPE